MKPPIASLPEPSRQALLACAVPRWFDTEVLSALLDDLAQGPAALAMICAHPSIRLKSDVPERYVLDQTTRDELLTLLQDEHLSLYKAFHKRAFSHFIDRLQSVTGDEQRVYEDELMHHLDELFFLFMDAYELSELAQALELAAKVSLSQSEYRHLLAYYRGCLDNEREDYDTAAVVYTQLLEEPDLKDGLRARTLTALGINYDYRSQFDRAIEAYRQSREAYARLGDILGEGKALKNMGIIYHQLTEYRKALPLFETSYRLFQEAGNLVEQGRALNELGYTHKELGRWNAALGYYEQSLDIWRQLGIRELEARVHNNLGEIHHLIGRWTEAQSHYEQALVIALDPRHENRREAADMLLNLGFLFCTQDRFDKAQIHYERALQLAYEIESLAAISQVHYRLGDLWERQGHPRKAYQAYRQAIEAIEAMRGRVERQEVKISLLGTRQQPYEAMVLLCRKLDWLPKAFHYVERAKARAFLDLLIQRVVTTRGAKPDIGLAEEPLTVRQVQRRLPPDAVLVEYFTTGVLDWGEGIIQNLPPEAQSLREYLTPPAQTLAFVVTRRGLECRDLPVSPNTLRPGPTDQLGGQRFLDEQKLRRLYDVLVEPVHECLQGAQVIYLVPHGPLHYVPFQALRRPGDRYLLREDGPQLAYAPSATVLLRYCQRGPSKAPESCLALGYNGRGKTALHHAEDEAQAIARLWNGQAWTGEESKKALLYSMQDRYRLIHLSCHGQFIPQDPLASALTLGEGELLTALEILDHLRLEADLVTLSACESGVSRITRGDELVGLVRAFISAGTPSLVVTQWKVEEVSTRIVMERFHRNLVVGLGKAAALQEAQCYLRSLSIEELRKVLTGYGRSEVEIENQVGRLSTDRGTDWDAGSEATTRVFSHPRYWAPFILVGDHL